MDALEQARAEIDTVDAQLAALFERRMAAVLQVAEYKRAHGLPIYDAAREAAVLEKRGQEFMNAAQLCQLMLQAQQDSYGDGLDKKLRHPYMWVCKSHYYGSTFYNFPYAFGGLFARGLYARYEQEGAAFVPTYKQLLRTTTVATAEDTAKVAGIDLTDKSFWRSALLEVEEKIDQFCQLVGEP